MNKGKDKKDLLIFVDERVAEINNSMITLTGRVDDSNKCMEELQSTRDFEELRGKLEVVVNSM